MSRLDQVQKIHGGCATWRQCSQAAILDAYDRMRSESAPWMTPAKLIPLIRRHEFPWGERKQWPYRAWLMACQDVLAFLEHRPLPKRVSRHLRNLNPLEQMGLELGSAGNCLKDYSDRPRQCLPPTAGAAVG